MLAWQGRVYGENWDMVGILFIVWPITLVVVLLAVAEFFMLRGREDREAKHFRILAVVLSSLMLILSASGLFIGEW